MFEIIAAILGLVLSAGTAAADYQKDKKQQKLVDAQEALKLKGLDDFIKQKQEQTAVEKSERARRAMIERGRLEAAAGGDTSSGSALRLANDIEFQEGYDLSLIKQNDENVINQSRREGEAVQLTSASMRPEGPSAFLSALQIGGQAVGEYSDYRSGRGRYRRGRQS